jgi:hypothetical protein
MPRTRIPIDEEHLSKGKSCAPLECALALAINEVLKEDFFSSVGPKEFHIFNSQIKKVFTCRNEPEITKFIDKFEDGIAQPTTIVLDIPAEFLK